MKCGEGCLAHPASSHWDKLKFSVLSELSHCVIVGIAHCSPCVAIILIYMKYGIVQFFLKKILFGQKLPNSSMV